MPARRRRRHPMQQELPLDFGGRQREQDEGGENARNEAAQAPRQLPFSFNDAQNLAARLDEAEQNRAGNEPLMVGTGNYSFMDKTRRLMDSVSGTPFEQRALSQLEWSRENPREYAAVLQTLDYSALLQDNDVENRGRGMDLTLEALEMCRVSGRVPVGQMNRLLKVGVVFDSRTKDFGDRFFEMEGDLLSGGAGYGRGVRIHGDIPFPRLKEGIVRQLHAWDIDEVVVRGGEEKRIERAPKKQLQAVFAKEFKRRRGETRRRERLLDQI